MKTEPEDFVVEEIPLYQASGTGQHLYVEIEKRGLSTYVAINRIARALKTSPNQIGYAGLKDAQAITRQTLSIDQGSAEAVEALNLPGIKILNISHHKNKLRIGHLIGNRFVLRVRDVTEQTLPIATAVLSRLQEKGVPNFFGEQRFGNRSNTQRLGEMLIRQNVAEFVAEYLGRPQLNEAAYVQVARRLVDEGRWAEALAKWPHNLPDERRVLSAIVAAEGQIEVAFGALHKKNLKSFFISAFQAQLFNELLAERLDRLDRLETGDVAFIHGKGAAFLVEEVEVEQPRADVFEISPSGPLFGPKMILAEGKPGQRERASLAKQGLTLDDFNITGLKTRGTRRPYRFNLKDAKIWWDDGLMISFELPPGAYATRVMAEIMKGP